MNYVFDFVIYIGEINYFLIFNKLFLILKRIFMKETIFGYFKNIM